jgi:UPF0755 protein
MFKRSLLVIIIIGVLVVIAIGVPPILLFMAGRKQTINKTEKSIIIRENFTASELAQFLIEKGIVDSEKSFVTIANELGLDNKTIARGKYIILSGTNYLNLCEGFILQENGHGKSEVKVNVIFSASQHLGIMAQEVEKCLMVDSLKLMTYLESSETLQQFGFTKEQFPSMFFPGKYSFYFDTNEQQFVDSMAKEFKSFWTDERKAQLKKIGLNSPSQLSTLASIVYSEQSRHEDEWPTIAALYLNRIKQGMKLQSDPTFKFCWGNQLSGVSRLTALHRQIDCPYNTYIYKGLPPGPICLTPKRLLEAVLYPDDVDYLFMCAKPDYSFRHKFEKSDVAHMKNAATYQKWLSEELKKRK